jgi:glycosyltransferase involved in cell wall biosynthesis
MTEAPLRKIAVILKGYPRLSETFIAQELLGLERAGFDLTLISLRHPTDTKRHPVHDEIRAPVSYLPEYLYQEPLRVLRGWWRARRLPGYRRARQRFLRDLVRDVTPNRVRRFGQACVMAAEWRGDRDWIHAHFIHTPASVAAYGAMMLGLGWSCSAHAKDIWSAAADWDLAEKLAETAWVVTCTRAGHDRLRALAADPGRVHLSYHGLDLARFGHDAAARPARDGSDAADPVRILSVGRAVPKKGYDVLLDALARLPAGQHWRFEHIGGGKDLPALKAQADRLGISARIDWRGSMAQEAILARYRASDIFALACRIAPDGDRDGLPNVIVEAASQGMAVVSTTVSGVPELIADGVNGRLVAPEDADALAAALAGMIARPDERARLGTAAEARVRTAFDHHTSIRDLTALFGSAGGGSA